MRKDMGCSIYRLISLPLFLSSRNVTGQVHKRSFGCFKLPQQRTLGDKHITTSFMLL